MEDSGLLNNQQKESDIIDISTSECFDYDQTTQNDKDEILDNQISAGQHFIIDFWGEQFLQDVDVIEQALKDAAIIAGAILLHIHLHKFADQGGVTGVALLAESHISVHTWPEDNYAAFDVFMCGNAQPEKAIELLKQVFQPTKVEVKKILRGKF